MRPSLKTQRLIALAVAGTVILNFPLLTLWDSDGRVFDLPLLPLALFVAWAVLIACAAWIVRIQRKAGAPWGDDDDTHDKDP
jgi:hypothetical protein